MAKKRQGIRCSYLYIDWKSIGDSVVEVVVIIETNRPFGVSPRMEKKLFFAHYSSITVSICQSPSCIPQLSRRLHTRIEHQ
jgi:hypothetical protein